MVKQRLTLVSWSARLWSPVSWSPKGLGAIAFLLSLGVGESAIAQTVNADGTVGTTVNGTGPFTITGGTIRGDNLFHSFTDFSPATAATTFDLNNASYGGSANNITTIFSRVTGSSLSQIDGLLQVLGGIDPDFFLINPNGIIFGPDAHLDLNGSFIGSTAESILFPGGVEFSARDRTVAPLLTINRPIGLQMGSSPGDIAVTDTGHQLVRTTFFQPTDRTSLLTTPSSRLQVDTGQTLALVGGNITLNGGVLTAEAGNVELGAVQAGQVDLSPQSTGWILNHSPVETFGNISLAQQALVDVSSDVMTLSPAGSVSLQGATVHLDDGSVVLGQNRSGQAGGTIQVQATDTVQLQGSATTTIARSSLRTESFGLGSSGEIQIQADRLTVSDEAPLQTITFGSGNASALTIAVKTLDILAGSLVGSITFGAGNAEMLKVTTQTLNALDGSILASVTLNNPLAPGNTGAAGTVQVTADTINVAGANAEFASAGGIGSVSFSAGASGDVNITTKRLDIRDGGRVSTEISNTGAAGDLNIVATEQILIRDTPTTGEATGIFTSGKTQSTFTQTFFALPAIPTGNSGNINLQTPYLEVRDRGSVTARNEGVGDSGDVKIQGDVVYLNEGGNISTSTLSGEGGGITLDLQRLLLLRRGSFISTEAGGAGNGGNIAIAAPVIAGYENSDIIANAFQGNGGNITITTQGIFGLVLRDRLTPENDITASSQFGLNGTLSVNEFSLNPSVGLFELATTLRDASDQVNATCAATGNSEFINTGRGGVPPAPTAPTLDQHWQDLRDLDPFWDVTTSTPPTASTAPPQLREATGFQAIANGQIRLVAQEVQVPELATTTTCGQQMQISQALLVGADPKPMGHHGGIAPTEHLHDTHTAQNTSVAALAKLMGELKKLPLFFHIEIENFKIV